MKDKAKDKTKKSAEKKKAGKKQKGDLKERKVQKASKEQKDEKKKKGKKHHKGEKSVFEKQLLTGWEPEAAAAVREEEEPESSRAPEDSEAAEGSNAARSGNTARSGRKAQGGNASKHRKTAEKTEGGKAGSGKTEEGRRRREAQALIFRALGDESRLQILDILEDQEMCAADLLKLMPIVQSTLSHHMKILCEAGLVICRKQGRWSYYTVNKQLFEEAADRLRERAQSEI